MRVVATLLSCFAAAAGGCATDQRGLDELDGEQREVGQAALEYLDAFAAGDAEAFCERVYAHDTGSGSYIPTPGDDCDRQQLNGDDAVADARVEAVTVSGERARAKVALPQAPQGELGGQVELRLRRFSEQWRVRFDTR